MRLNIRSYWAVPNPLSDYNTTSMSNIKSKQTKTIANNGSDPINVHVTETQTITDNGDCVTSIKTKTTRDNKDHVINIKTTKTETATGRNYGISIVKTKTETLSDSMGLGTNETESEKEVSYGISSSDWELGKGIALTVGIAGIAGVYLLATRGRSSGLTQQLFRRNLSTRTFKNSPVVESEIK